MKVLAGYDHHLEWLMKHQKEADRGDQGWTNSSREGERDGQRKIDQSIHSAG